MLRAEKIRTEKERVEREKILSEKKAQEERERKLKEKQIQLAFEVKIKLVQHVPTRWNSIYDMLESILLNKDALTLLSLEVVGNTFKTNMPKEDEFEVIKDFYKLLQPMKDLTKFLSAWNYVTASQIYPIIHYIFKEKFANVIVSTSHIQTIKTELLHSIKGRFSYLLNEKFFWCCTFLDYRFKKFEFVKDEIERNQIREKAIEFLIELEKSLTQKGFIKSSSIAKSSQQPIPSNESISNRRGKGLVNLFETLYDKPTSTDTISSVFADEVNSYLNYVTLSSDNDSEKIGPLSFYKNHKGRFPRLTKIAKIMYSVPVTSIPSESLFSQVGLIQTDLRSRLEPAFLEKLTLIKQNKT